MDTRAGTMTRVYNFGAGPAILPEEAIREAQAELLDFKGSGMSILEHSHRGKEYESVHNEAVVNIRKLMNLPDDHAVLFLTGGASQQFAQVPMNLLGEGQTADYVNSGTWASKAIKEAKIIGKVHLCSDVTREKPARMPLATELKLTQGAAYVHVTSNETIEGTQWKTFPKTASPLVADMSSDILSRPIDARQFGLIYAGAQKNIGPAGVTLVVIRQDLAERVSEKVPIIFRYKTQLAENSLYNTPPCFAIYVLALTTRLLIQRGGVEVMERINENKARRLYDGIDSSGGYYGGTASKDSRSLMNVTFRLPSEELEEKFVKEASSQGMKGLKGHRSVGGIRASIYNAFPPAGVDALVAFMQDFQRRNG